MPNQIPLDPALPAHFFDLPNEERSKEELDAWWDHPFGQTREGGMIDVRCLNGGAWDRPMWLGQAATYDEACELAAVKQSEWVKRRAQPSPFLDQPPKLIRFPQRPDQSLTVLKEFESIPALNAYVEAAGSIEGLLEALAREAAPGPAK